MINLAGVNFVIKVQERKLQKKHDRIKCRFNHINGANKTCTN